jgi:hypothetical protein
MTSLYPPDGPQTAAQVLDSGFRVFKASLVRCLLFGAIAMIAGQLPNIYSLAIGQPFDAYLRGEPVSIALAIIGSIATVYFSGVMLLRQREVAQGQRRSTRAELAHAFRRLPTFLCVTIVALAAAGAAAFLVIAVSMFAVFKGGWADWLFQSMNPVVLDVLLGLLAVPLVWLLPGLVVAVAVSVLTESGIFSSLRQGVSLVVGSWWRTMVTFTVWGVLLVIFNFITVIIVVMSMPLVGANDLPTTTAGTQVVFVALRALGLPFLVAVVLVVYGELQVRRQGVDLQRRMAGMAHAPSP